MSITVQPWDTALGANSPEISALAEKKAISTKEKSKVDKFYRLFILKNPFYKKGFSQNPEVLLAYKWYFDTIFTNRERMTQELAPFVKKCDVEIEKMRLKD